MTLTSMPVHFFGYINILEKQGKIDEAIKIYDYLLEKNPVDSYLISNYSRFLREDRKVDEAFELLSRKCKIPEVANNALVQYEIIDNLEYKIKKSPYRILPINNHDQIKQFLMSKKFGEKYIEYLIEKNKEFLDVILEYHNLNYRLGYVTPELGVGAPASSNFLIP